METEQYRKPTIFAHLFCINNNEFASIFLHHIAVMFFFSEPHDSCMGLLICICVPRHTALAHLRAAYSRSAQKKPSGFPFSAQNADYSRCMFLKLISMSQLILKTDLDSIKSIKRLRLLDSTAVDRERKSLPELLKGHSTFTLICIKVSHICS